LLLLPSQAYMLQIWIQVSVLIGLV
jgi:hypothetical protein